MSTPPYPSDDPFRNLPAQIRAWQGCVLDYEIVVDDRRRDLDRAVEDFQIAVRERDRAAVHLQHLINFQDSLDFQDSRGDLDHAFLVNVASEDRPERKLVVTFEDANHRPIVLNLTRSEAIAALAGTSDYERWCGTHVRVSRGTTLYAGKKVPCIVIGESEILF